ncbi:MAG TPA: hypothetical protein VGD58_16895 [Herpetosiphonaceae bacterium]
MKTRSPHHRFRIVALALVICIVISALSTGRAVPGAVAAYAADPAFVCTGTWFFAPAGDGAVFNVGDTWQGGTFTYIEDDGIMRVREEETGDLVGRFPVRFTTGDQATIEFDRIIRIISILWHDNDPNPGEQGWSFNGIAGPITGQKITIITPVDLATDTVMINAGGDSGGIDFCYEEVVRDAGCTPGYWKNHLAAWSQTGYAPAQTLESAFDVPDALGIDNTTLAQALGFGGGSGVAGGARILLRAGVAALLNGAHSGVAYPYTANRVIADVNAALASNDRATMLALATTLDNANNGGCPLN